MLASLFTSWCLRLSNASNHNPICFSASCQTEGTEKELCNHPVRSCMKVDKGLQVSESPVTTCEIATQTSPVSLVACAWLDSLSVNWNTSIIQTIYYLERPLLCFGSDKYIKSHQNGRLQHIERELFELQYAEIELFESLDSLVGEML